MFPARLGLAIGAFGLALFAVSQMVLYASRFDPAFFFVPLGAATLGLSAAWGRRDAAPPGSGSPENEAEARGVAGARGLAATGMLAVGALALAGTIPVGSLPWFLLTVAVLIVAYDRGGRATRALMNEEIRPVLQHAIWLVPAVAGIALGPRLVDLLGGPVRVGWLTASLFGIASFVPGGRRRADGWARTEAWVGVVALVPIVAAGLVLIRATPSGLPERASHVNSIVAPGFGRSRSPGDSETSRASDEPRREPARIESTRWTSLARIDTVVVRAEETTRWTLADGESPVPVPWRESGPEGADPSIERLLDRYPLLAHPMLFSRAGRGVVITPRPGPEARIAEALDMSSFHVLSAHDPLSDPRRKLRSHSGDLDLILLITTHTDPSLVPRHHALDPRLYTLEAFREIRNKLAPAGLLAFVTYDERLFVRGLLTAWKVFAAETDDGPLADRAWALKLGSDAPFWSPYRYLLLISAAPFKAGRLDRFENSVGPIPVKTLFGPGRRPVDRYASFGLNQGRENARGDVRKIFSARSGTWLNLEPARDRGESFFRITAPLPPPLKWLFAGCVLATILALVMPRSERRHVYAPGAGSHPPIPVLLSPFVLYGAGASIAIVATAATATEVAAVPPTESAGWVGAVLAGFAIGSIRVPASRAAIVGGVAAAILFYGMRALPDALLAGDSPMSPVGRSLSLAASGALLGLAIALPLARIRHILSRDLPDLLRWGPTLFGIATLGAPSLTHWTAQVRGPDWPWNAAVIGSLAALGAVLWGEVVGRGSRRKDG
jgi:hypothetical protein